MNNSRRKQIKHVLVRLEEVLRRILVEEKDAFENMPESLQLSANGITSEEAQDYLESAADCIAEAITYLEDI